MATPSAPGESSIKLPGLGLPVNHCPEDHFPSAINEWEQTWPHTNRERCMISFMEGFTLQKDWHLKAFQPMVLEIWKEELKETDWRRHSGIQYGDFTDKMFDYCVDELQEKAKLYQETGIVPVLDVEARLARSDIAISPEIQESLKRAVTVLEQTATQRTDWNPGKENTSIRVIDPTPGENNVFLNLIDPAMYPLMYGHSRVLPDKEIGPEDCLRHIGKGVIIPVPKDLETFQMADFSYTTEPGERLWSHKSQWLPCNVEFPDGINAKITSYVNNLHPQDHADVYALLERIITKAMPLWNLVYSTIYEKTTYEKVIPCNMRIHCMEAYKAFPGTAPYDPLNIKDDLMNGLIDDDEWQRRTDRWITDRKVVVRPEPGNRQEQKDKNTVPPGAIEDHTAMLGAASGIQVIVKLRAAYPIPEHPECDLRSRYHLDGALNEHIVATAVYFFDDENVTDTRIWFRSRFQGLNFEEDCAYEWGDSQSIEETFGFGDEEPSLQTIGSVTMREGLMLAYPNVLQHKESSFKLKDPTKPGYRKVLTLHLVDPRVRILSTANVPPQQAEWWGREFADEGGQFNGLPKEVVDMVVSNVTDFPIPRDEARRLRDEMLVERGEIEDATRHVLTSYIVNDESFGRESSIHGSDLEDDVDAEWTVE